MFLSSNHDSGKLNGNNPTTHNSDTAKTNEPYEFPEGFEDGTVEGGHILIIGGIRPQPRKDGKKKETR